MNKYLEIIHKKDIYKDFDLLSPNITTCNISNANTEFIFGNYNKPEVVIIEVGSFLGCSIIHIANYFLKRNIKPLIFCIDTWLGDTFMRERGQDLWMNWLNCKNGYPTLYYQFLSNIIYSKLQEYVVPIPHTSFDAYRYLSKLQISTDFCYLDASHDFEEVYFELINYYKLVKINGTLFGDDYDSGWSGVVNAVNKFSVENNIQISLLSDSKYIIRK